jgi:DNA-binding MarR family transcriptional regulator
MTSSEPQAGPTGWASITALAELKGWNKAAISRRVARFEEAGLLRARRGPKGEKLVNIEAFDRLIESQGDAVQEMNGMRASADTDPILSREQAKRAAADAEMKRMDLEERRGRIISADHAERFVDTCSANAQTVLWRLPGLVEEIVSIATKDGVPAARAFVKEHIRAAIAEVGAMVRMVADPQGEPVGSQKQFSQTLETRGLTRRKTEVAQGFLGLRLREKPDPRSW